MTDAEKIEALRKWAEAADRPSLNDYYLIAVRQVRDIIDPPKPKWRQKVGQAAKVVTDNPLEGVLKHLSVIAYNPSPEGLEWKLARIVAICEAQVGDGWQADPDDWPDSWDDPVDVWSLLDALCDTEDKWQSIGDRAATWLRSLTDGGTAHE